jgi:hypothetical protein
MSIRNPEELRFLKRNQLEQEAKVISNYYRDIIRQMGIDCIYIKQDTEYPTIINPTLSAYEDIIYGEQNNMSYSASADMVVYMEVEQDLFALNQEGSLPDSHYIVSFMIDEYASKFAYLVGGNDEFKTALELSGAVDNYSASLSSTFEIEGLSGIISYDFDLSGATSGFYTPTISDLTPDYQREVLINPYIKESKSYTITDDDNVVAFIGDYTSNIDGNGDGVITSNVGGSLLYSSINSINRYRETIRPSVGDIIRLDFPAEVNFEEYEITQVYDRQLTDGGINPLLHKYIYRCDMIRRTPSGEEIFGDDESMEAYAKDFLDVIEKTQHAHDIISDEVDDYSDNVDDIYGGYGSTDNKVPDVDEFITDVEVDEEVIIHTFVDESTLFTNGFDLFFTNATGITSKLTTFDITGIVEDVPVDLMYLKSDGVDIYFMNKNGLTARMTDNDGTGYTQIPINTKLYDFDNDSTMNGMFYMFKSSSSVLYTDTVNLYTRNDSDVITQLTSN